MIALWSAVKHGAGRVARAKEEERLAGGKREREAKVLRAQPRRWIN